MTFVTIVATGGVGYCYTFIANEKLLCSFRGIFFALFSYEGCNNKFKAICK